MEQIISGKVTSYQRLSAIAHMTRKIKNENGVKLLSALMVLAIAFVGVAFVASDCSGADTSNNEAKIGETEYSTLQYALDDAEAGQTIVLLKDVSICAISASSGVLIDGGNEGHKISFTATGNQIQGKVSFKNVVLEATNMGTEPRVQFTGSSDSVFNLENVTIDQIADVYHQGTTFNATNCQFNNELHLQIAEGSDYNFKGTNVADLKVNPPDDYTVIISSVGTGAQVTIDSTSVLDKMTVVDSSVEIKDCSIKVGQIRGYSQYAPRVVIDDNATIIHVGDKPLYDETITIVDTGLEFTNTITLGDGAVVGSSTQVIASSTQEVIISGDVTVVSGGVMNISGKLTILEDASLAVETGGVVLIKNSGMVDVKGDLVIEGANGSESSFGYEGGQMSVSGSVSIEGSNAFKSTGVGIEISGLFEVGDGSTADLAGATVTKDGALSVNGIVNGSVTNNGTISIDSQGFDGVSSDLTIQLGAEGVVDIINVYGTVEVIDGTNKVELQNVAGAKVTETVKRSGNTETRTLNLAGTIIAAVNFDQSDLTGKITITQGKVATSGDVVLGDKVGMTISGNTELTVTAGLISEYTMITHTAAEGTDITTVTSPITGDGTMTVAGKVTAKTSVDVEVNAAMYQSASPAYYIYTTLGTALTDGATTIALKGTNSIDVDATIPVGVTVTMDSGSELTVEDKAVLTVAADDRNSARFDTTADNATVDVEGTLVVTNLAKSKVQDAFIVSDTSKVSDKSITYTNIYNALAEASQGETVTVRATEVTLSKDLVIENGVTLSIPAGKILTVDNGVTVTVNGTVYAAGGYALAPESEDGSEAAGVTVVNGLFLYTKGITFSDKIVGAYFQYLYSVNNSTVNAIAPLTSVPGMMDKVRSDITLNGKMTVSTVDFTAYDGEQVELIAGGELTFDELTLGPSVKFIVTDNVKVNGSIVLANGSVDVKNVVGFSAYNETDAEDVTTSYFDGTAIALYTDGDATVKGSISFDGVVTLRVISVAVPMDVPEEATVTIQSGVYNGEFTVEGTVIIDGTEIWFKDLTVFGTVNAEDEGSSAEAVRLFVGVTSDDFARAGTGSVTGVEIVTALPATISEGAPHTGFAYVSPNATVGEEITELASTEYYVDGALYLTAYAAGEDIAIDEVELALEDVWFGGWSGVDESSVVGEPAKVDAVLEYEIFSVQVVVDSGIGTVAIDGNVLVNASGNVFTTAAPLKAGQHTVTYTLKSGYTGEAVLSVNGEGATVSGMNFSVSGTPETDEISGKMVPIEVQLSLLGTIVSDTPSIVIPSQPAESDDMGLTEYLLIVLVILAAILVVVVAIRMMRS